MDYIKAIDLNTIDFIRKYISNEVLDNIFPVITNLGEGGAIWIAISLGLILNRKYRKVGILVLLVLFTNYLIGDILIKNLIERERPFISIEGIEILVKAPNSFSFPSGHTSSAFAAATILSLYLKKYAPLFFIMAALLGFSRIYLYVHYLSDVMAGMLLGIIVALICNIFANKFYKKKLIEI